ncbi:MAG: hypothetical protein IJ891_06010 [Prevotella sp.]|nr:hypothetical protein [Prevotella sp.]
MRKIKYIVPTTERVTLKMYQNVMDDFDYGDADVTSIEDLIINARKGDFEEEMDVDSSLPVSYSIWDDETDE